jgi:hypothetical protein
VFGLTRGSWRTAVAASLAVTACLLFVPAAGAANIRNGGFEEGNFQGWTVADKGEAGSWFVYSGTATPLNSIPVVAPPEGTFAAVTDQFGPGAHVLYQTLKLGTEGAQVLSFTLYYRNLAREFCTPSSLDSTGEEGCNQQYRVDILRKGADPFSVSSNDVLRTLFRTEVGDPLTLGPTPMSFKLTHLHGKVILRFAEVDTETFFNASVDDVTLKSA